MSQKRKLAAIMFTDMVGFSRLVSLDEQQGLKRLKQVERLVSSCAGSHNGRVVKTIGDAVMIEFASALDSVLCAFQIQKQLRNLSLALEEHPVQVRIGIHAGDVVEAESDLYGSAVNIAAKIQKFAPTGGICLSREMCAHIRSALKFSCEPIASSLLVELPEPIEVFSVSAEAEFRVLSPPKTDALAIRDSQESVNNAIKRASDTIESLKTIAGRRSSQSLHNNLKQAEEALQTLKVTGQQWNRAIVAVRENIEASGSDFEAFNQVLNQWRPQFSHAADSFEQLEISITKSLAARKSQASDASLEELFSRLHAHLEQMTAGINELEQSASK